MNPVEDTEHPVGDTEHPVADKVLAEERQPVVDKVLAVAGTVPEASGTVGDKERADRKPVAEGIADLASGRGTETGLRIDCARKLEKVLKLLVPTRYLLTLSVSYHEVNFSCRFLSFSQEGSPFVNDPTV